MPGLLLALVAALTVMGLAPAAALGGGSPRIVMGAQATAGAELDVVVTATTKRGKRDKGFRGLVSVTTGDPHGQAPPPHKFTRKDRGRFTFSGLELRSAGNQTVTARAGKRSSSASVAVTSAGLDRLSVSPSSAVVSPPAPIGAHADFTALGSDSPATSQWYAVSGSDRFGNPLGDVSTAATWSIAPDGACAGAVCSPASPGPHTVTATIGAVTGSAQLDVATLEATYSMTCQGQYYDVDHTLADGCEAPLDHLTVSAPSAILALPAPVGVNADYTPVGPGSPQTSQAYAASGSDASNNPLGDLTSASIWTMSPDGSCLGSVCSPASPGPHTVTATAGSVFASAPLSVEPLATTYGMTCQGENYDVNQAFGDGCEVAEPNPGHTTAATARDLGYVSKCDDQGPPTRFGAIISDSRVHANPSVSGFDSNIGGAGDYYRAQVEDDNIPACAMDYDAWLNYSGGAASPSGCYKLTVSWRPVGGGATESESMTFSGTGAPIHLSGVIDFPGLDDSAIVLVGLEPLCFPPRNEKVDFQLTLHF